MYKLLRVVPHLLLVVGFLLLGVGCPSYELDHSWIAKQLSQTGTVNERILEKVRLVPATLVFCGVEAVGLGFLLLISRRKTQAQSLERQLGPGSRAVVLILLMSLLISIMALNFGWINLSSHYPLTMGKKLGEFAVPELSEISSLAEILRERTPDDAGILIRTRAPIKYLLNYHLFPRRFYIYSEPNATISEIPSEWLQKHAIAWTLEINDEDTTKYQLLPLRTDIPAGRGQMIHRRGDSILYAKLILALALIMASGILTLRCITRNRPELTTLEIFSLAFGIGLGFLSLGLFYLAYCHIPLDSVRVRLLLSGLLLGPFSLSLFLGHERLQVGGLSRNGSKKQRLNGLEIGFLLIIVASSLLIFLDAISNPILGFDARAIWGMKAKLLFTEHQIYGDAFLDPARLHAKHQYPLALPLAQSFIYQWGGRIDEHAVKVLYPLFFLSLAVFFYASLRRFFGRSYSLFGTAFLSSLPAFTIYVNGGAASGYSDVPLAYCFTVFAVSLFKWASERKRSDFVIAVFFAIFALFTKNEGLPLVGITLFCFTLLRTSGLRDRLFQLKYASILSLCSLLALAPWYHYRLRLPQIEEDYFSLLTLPHIAAGMERLAYIVPSFLREFFLKPHLWSLLGVCLAFVFCFSPARALRGPHSVFLWIAFFYGVFIVLVYIVTPWQMEQIIPLSLTRLLMPLVPITTLWMLFQIKETDLLPEDWIMD